MLRTNIAVRLKESSSYAKGLCEVLTSSLVSTHIAAYMTTRTRSLSLMFSRLWAVHLGLKAKVLAHSTLLAVLSLMKMHGIRLKPGLGNWQMKAASISWSYSRWAQRLNMRLPMSSKVLSRTRTGNVTRKNSKIATQQLTSLLSIIRTKSMSNIEVTLPT